MIEEIKFKLLEYKDQIVLGALILGILSIFDILPMTVKTMDIGERIKWVYIAGMCIGAYTFYTFFYGKIKGYPSYVKTVAPRTVGKQKQYPNIDPSGTYGASQQRTKQPQSRPPPASSIQPEQTPKPSDAVFDTFNKE